MELKQRKREIKGGNISKKSYINEKDDSETTRKMIKKT